MSRKILFAVLVAVVLWGIELFDQWFVGGGLDHFGIQPRRISGLWGIVWAPWLHVGFRHLATNTMPLLLLGLLVSLCGMWQFFLVTAIITIFSGFGVWVIGASSTVHVGASGLIFGFLGFLLTVGVTQRSLVSLTIAIVVGLFYGGSLWAILPGQTGISWQSHLFGLLGGILAARILGRFAEPRLL